MFNINLQLQLHLVTLIIILIISGGRWASGVGAPSAGADETHQQECLTAIEDIKQLGLLHSI